MPTDPTLPESPHAKRRQPDDPAPVYDVHVFCCTNQRPTTHRRGCCGSKNAEVLCNYMCRRAMVTAAQQNIRINLSGCLNLCEYGPAMVIYPEGVWYHYETEADIEEIMERHVKRGERVERLIIRDFSRMHR
jgi:(2Fe-2S) ferredoxin